MKCFKVALLFAVLLVLLSLLGCNTTKQFSAAASPVVTDVTGDLTQYVLPTNPQLAEEITAINTAVTTGDRAAVAMNWYGGVGKDSLRDAYTAFLASNNPLFSGEAGQFVRRIKSNSVRQIDYVLTVGTSNP